MARKIALKSPRLVVVLGNPDDESTWTEVPVQTIGSDMERVEAYYAKAKRPLQEYPIESQRMLGYFALRRSGRIAPDVSPDDYAAGHIETMGAGVETIRPTPEEASTV